jgi:serine/threonine-protein phosphatase 2A regulatory subunit B
MSDEEEHNWKFAQCFGDKGDSDDITDGKVKSMGNTYVFF